MTGTGVLPSHVVGAYYGATADRIEPFLAGRRGRILRHNGTRDEREWPLRAGQAFREEVGQGGSGFSISPTRRDGEVWCVMHLTPRRLPFEAVRLTALKTGLALRDADLEGVFCFDGLDGLFCLWSYGVPDPDHAPAGWDPFHHDVIRRLRGRTEMRLRGTPERNRLGFWVGPEGPVTLVLTGQEQEDALAEAELDRRVRPRRIGEDPLEAVCMRAVALQQTFRCPWTIHPQSGRVAVPLSREDLYRFKPDTSATAESARRIRRRLDVPFNFPSAVVKAFDLQGVF